ncbi:uncharacterized protein KQ657_001362 [Scheffersomyces spartinae]|uniref:Uncharacterized protein n=1 Tax=Scheffersomyces spartinae TaxID=45513 RepID=A0A9P7V7Q6_9ASCO|nr:uncharacterized protein KQ657_001362 [Scheffersomyces spartinae]KAG7192905.1 hypothetical protein KQ657_001362 [Scheffersomyces spartinae]
MSLGTLFATQQIRSVPPKAIIKHYGLDVKISDKEDPLYTKNFPIAKIPAFIGPKGLKLHEVIPITINLVQQAEENSPLLGKTQRDFIEILKWLSFTNSEVLVAFANAIKPIRGDVPFNKKVVEDNYNQLVKLSQIYENRLVNYTFLVGERLTLADVFSAALLVRPFENFFDAEWRKQYPNTARWFRTIVSLPILKDIVGDVPFIAKKIALVPANKEKKEQKSKEAAAPKKKQAAAPKAAAEVDDAPVEEKKPKHPLELLGKAANPLDNWKRVYSNEDTRPKAIPWFWENQWNPEEWSMWKLDYKYNEELEKTFMTNNQIGGFFARLSASTKYLFGCLVVYGVDNDNGITGAFLVRGQEYAPAFDVAPDWDTYNYTKLNPENPDDKKFIENMFAWDEPVIVNGEKKEIADGKVFK